MRQIDAAPVALGVGIAQGLAPVKRAYFDAISKFDDESIIDTMMQRENNKRSDARAMRRRGM